MIGEFKGLSLPSRLRVIVFGLGADGLFSWFFYKSFIAFFLLLPFGIFVMYLETKNQSKAKKARIKEEFKDMLLFVSASLSAGYSVENAMKKSVDELRSLYGEASYMAHEMQIVSNELTLGVNISQAVENLSGRNEDEDIKTFSQVFSFARKSGGDMVSIMKRSAVIIDEKCRVLQDISVLIAGKKYEQSIMCFLPFLIIVYIDLAMPGIMACLYHNVFGICVMTCLMIIYSVAYMIGRKIMNIEV